MHIGVAMQMMSRPLCAWRMWKFSSSCSNILIRSGQFLITHGWRRVAAWITSAVKNLDFLAADWDGDGDGDGDENDDDNDEGGGVGVGGGGDVMSGCDFWGDAWICLTRFSVSAITSAGSLFLRLEWSLEPSFGTLELVLMFLLGLKPVLGLGLWLLFFVVFGAVQRRLCDVPVCFEWAVSCTETAAVSAAAPDSLSGVDRLGWPLLEFCFAGEESACDSVAVLSCSGGKQIRS
mgnify:CR=1 FL=1